MLQTSSQQKQKNFANTKLVARRMRNSDEGDFKSLYIVARTEMQPRKFNLLKRNKKYDENSLTPLQSYFFSSSVLQRIFLHTTDW